MRGKKRAKISVLEVEETRDIFFLPNRPIEENRVQVGKNELNRPEFSNTQKFKIHIPRRFRSPRVFEVLLHRAGSEQCISLGESNLIDPLTNEESEKITLRNMAIGMGKYSPISFRVALILGILNLANLIAIIFLILRARVL